MSVLRLMRAAAGCLLALSLACGCAEDVDGPEAGRDAVETQSFAGTIASRYNITAAGTLYIKALGTRVSGPSCHSGLGSALNVEETIAACTPLAVTYTNLCGIFTACWTARVSKLVVNTLCPGTWTFSNVAIYSGSACLQKLSFGPAPYFLVTVLDPIAGCSLNATVVAGSNGFSLQCL